MAQVFERECWKSYQGQEIAIKLCHSMQAFLDHDLSMPEFLKYDDMINDEKAKTKAQVGADEDIQKVQVSESERLMSQVQHQKLD